MNLPRRIRQLQSNWATQAVAIAGSLVVIVIAAHALLPGGAAPTAIIGPDTSHHQPYLSVSAAKAAGMTFQWLKASEGTGFADPAFATSRHNAVAGGLIPGAYHFLDPGNGAGQCDYFLRQLSASGGTSNLMLGLDVELPGSPPGPSYTDVINFLNDCQAKTPGRTWVVYTGVWYWGSRSQHGYLGNPPAPHNTVLWISIYVPGSGSPWTLLTHVVPQGSPGEPYAAAPINGWPDYGFRQYSSSAAVANISPVDISVTYKGLGFLQSLAGLVTTRPDLVVTNVAWSPATPASGNQVTFSATIKNQGNAATPTGTNIGIAFKVDGKEVTWSSNGTTPLAAGASRTQTANSSPSGAATWAATVGSHTVTAYVDDLNLIPESNDSNNTLNKSLVIAAPDTTKPTVSMNAPAAGSSATVGSTVTMGAAAADNVGVSKVEFYVDGALKGSDTTSPYSYGWNTTGAAIGNHSLTAKAYDAAGNNAVSAALTVVVKPPCTAAPTAPSSLAGASTIARQVRLSWPASVAAANCTLSGYKVWRAVGTTAPPVTAAPLAIIGTAPSYFDTAVADLTTYTYAVAAYDTSGHSSSTATTAITTKPGPDSTPPVVSLSSPASGAQIVAGATSTVSATATDNIAVSKVEFYLDASTTAFRTVSSPGPYSFSWSTIGIATGGHTITAKAYDAAGNSAISAATAFTIATATNPGDANNDKRVNSLDLSLLLSHDAQNYPPADFNHNGTIDAGDLTILLGHWTW